MNNSSRVWVVDPETGYIWPALRDRVSGLIVGDGWALEELRMLARLAGLVAP